jgi:eukaryotic-like serine/threonine-protein kinase
MTWLRKTLLTVFVVYVLRGLLSSLPGPVAWGLSLAGGALVLLAFHFRKRAPNAPANPPPSHFGAGQGNRLQEALGSGYRVKERLGAGAFGTVYVVEDLTLERELAIKVLDVIDRDTVARFQREAVILAHLRHPNLVPVYFVGSGPDLQFTVMPRIKGPNLRWLLTRHSPLGIETVTSVVLDLAAGLDEAHQAGVIHRDVKPENVLLDVEHRAALLADFGIAKILQPLPAGEEVVIGTLIGTPEYMSPEQCSGGAITSATDVYSLACVVYEMLAGAPPFSGPSVWEVFQMHRDTPAPSLRARGLDIPLELEATVLRGLAKAPGDRFVGAGAFARAVAGSSALPTTPGAWYPLIDLPR